MIPQIHQAELLNENFWLVHFHDPSEKRFPIMRVVPTTENPVSCPGGELWCKQFGCVPGDNVFTRAAPEVLLEEGQELPEDWESPWEDDIDSWEVEDDKQDIWDLE